MMNNNLLHSVIRQSLYSFPQITKQSNYRIRLYNKASQLSTKMRSILLCRSHHFSRDFCQLGPSA
jgi:hypothetical protein